MENQFHLDLHTHSIISYDGSTTALQYRRLFDNGIVDCAAVTDHNQISFAQELHQQFGDRIIVGEEILTQEGELIGLFLNELIPPGLSVLQTAKLIKEQQGLVYVPHALEKTRKGLSSEVLEMLWSAALVDIIEIFNARNREPWLVAHVEEFAAKHGIAQAASSDAHCLAGFGTSYNIVENLPTRDTLVGLIKQSSTKRRHAPILSLLCPLRNKIMKKIRA